MAALPFCVACASASHRSSSDAAWLDHHQHQQRVILGSSRTCHPLNPNALAVKSSPHCQSQPHSLNVSATQDIDGESSRSRTSAVSGSGVHGSSSPEGDVGSFENTEDLVEDSSGLVSEERESSSGIQSQTAEVNERVSAVENGEDGLWSVVIPTYNRLPILTKCLQALEEQVDYELGGVARFEVIVVDDGSTDGTVEFLASERAEAHEGYPNVESQADERRAGDLGRNRRNCGVEGQEVGTGSRSFAQQSRLFPHVKLVRQKHAGATTARNLGLKHASGAIIVFIDSDLVVTRSFLRAHGEALREAFLEDGDDRAFTYGRVVNTSNFENPQSEKVKITDYSAAFFATGNVAISRRQLLEAAKLLGADADGPFDAVFSEYGWEDLELGVRLKQGGARIKHAPEAVGYHWHPAFTVNQLPKLIEQEKQRGRNGVRFYQKHPNLNVQLMIQMTPFHELLWFILTLGGLLNERTLEPILRQLEMKDMNQIAAALVSPVLNWHTVQAVKEEAKRLKVN
ncbi:hypothetical protein Mapa_017760 [Marchantia paleacea]|nr:hypothetical protein Mapa_017760 [Marchantia paleacea]